MTIIARTAIAFALLAALVPLAHAQSDSCASATTITPGTYSGTTAGSTNDGTATCGQSAASPDVWYRFAAPAAGTLRLDTCGSAYDTVLSLHTACNTPAFACNDDTGGTCALGSTLVNTALVPTIYLIRVTGFNNATGAYTLHLAFEPANTSPDSCPNATTVTDGTSTGTTLGATNDAAGSCGQSAASPDVWFRYTAAANCPVQVNTCGSAYDTVLSVFSDCPTAGGTEIACNDDTGGACALGSTITFNATINRTYLFRVSGFNNAAGNFTLTIARQCPPTGPDVCVNALDIPEGTIAYSTLDATPDGTAPCGNSNTSPDVWFRFTPSQDADLIINTCNSSFDTVLSVHSACPGTDTNTIACNDDSCSLGSSVRFAATRNTPYLIRVAGFQGASGAFNLQVRLLPPGASGADVYVGELSSMVMLGREGDTISTAIDTPLCNSGSVPLETLRFPNPAHPFFVFNMYRLKGDRLEQIGQSWAKHMQGAAQGNACGFGCIPYADGSHLGVGCSDIYGSTYNGTQSIMGPRSEINPYTGAFNPATSHLNNPNTPPHTNISHRLQIRDADLDPALNAGATYFAEQYTLAHDDADHMNSLARERVNVTGTPGGAWNFDLSAAASINGPAIDSWPGATRFVAQPADNSDGRAIVRAKVTDNGNGTWHYEYAIYNHDLDRGVQAFSIHTGFSGDVFTNIGFHAPASHDEAFHNRPWSSQREGCQLTWATDRISPSNASNPIRWGTMYNFWFDSPHAPYDEGSASLVMYKPGAIHSIDVVIPVPSGIPRCVADIDDGTSTGTPDGGVTIDDLFYYLSLFEAGSICADFDNGTFTGTQDQGVTIDDLLYYILRFGDGC